jgi:hypothetical protein
MSEGVRFPRTRARNNEYRLLTSVLYSIALFRIERREVRLDHGGLPNHTSTSKHASGLLQIGQDSGARKCSVIPRATF